jgi:coenzyme PQQ precursor peptide PqqA
MAESKETTVMTWETPIVIEQAVGLEVTAYVSDEDGSDETWLQAPPES